MSTSITHIPPTGALPKAYMGGTRDDIPSLVLGDDITVLFQPTRPEDAVAYLTVLIAEATELLAKVKEAQA